MPSAARVAIVIPTYNSTQHLAATIDSVLAQTETAWQLVLYDDGSKDGTADMAREYARRDDRITVVVGGGAGGVATARNHGYAATDPATECVIFLDHDDVWEPDLLETLIGVLDADPSLAGAHAVARSIDGEGAQPPGDDLADVLRARRGYDDDRLVPRPPDAPTTFADLVEHNWPVSPGLLLVRRSARDAVGGFDPRAVPSDDWDMNLRLSRHGDLGYVDRVLLSWRRTADAQSFQSRRWLQSHFYVRRKTLVDRTNTAAQSRAARAAWSGVVKTSMRSAVDAFTSRQLARAGREAGVAAWGCALSLEGWMASRLPRRTA